MKPKSLIPSVFSLIVGVTELVLGALLVTVRLLGVLVGAVSALRHARGITCPAKHPFKSDGVWICGACKFSYEGSVWQCRFCRATTPHHPCPVCQLGIASPYRYGRTS